MRKPSGLPIDVLLVGEGGSWAMRNRILLEAFGHRCVVASSMLEAAAKAHDFDAALVFVGASDPLVGVAGMWQRNASLPVILCGDDISDPIRSAAFEAGVAFVTKAEPLPQELDALLRLVCEQNRVGSPELVRGMTRTMCSLSTLIATATDTSFLKTAVHEVSALFTAPVVSIMLFDDDSEDAALRLVAEVGLDPAYLHQPPRRGGVAEHVIQSGKPRIILRKPESNGLPVVGRPEITASMCVPIPCTSGPDSQRPRGVINVARRRAYSVFTPRDLDVCISIAGLIGEALSVLEAREASANLRQRMQAVERLSTVGELAAGIAHEVANPIACVRTNVGTIIEYLTELAPALAKLEKDDAAIAEILNDLPTLLCETWEGLMRTDDVVRHMKALVRLNGPTARDERVPLGTLVEDTLRLMRPRLRAAVQVQIDKSVFVTGSSGELSQVIINLLVNASDACEERQRQEETQGRSHAPLVTVSVGSTGRDVTLQVVDNGVGIAPDLLKRVFLPLFTTKASDKGTGLGLSIVRRIVEDHGGQVGVRSSLGVGTAFSIQLPLAASDVDFLHASSPRAVA